MEVMRAKLTDLKEIVDFQSTISADCAFIESETVSRDIRFKWMESHLKNIDDYCDLILAKSPNGRIVGHVSIGFMDEPEIKHQAGIKISVLGAYQRQGIATQLLDHAEKWAKTKKLQLIRARVTCENLPATFFLLKNEFQFEGLKKNSFFLNDRYLDEYILTKKLSC